MWFVKDGDDFYYGTDDPQVETVEEAEEFESKEAALLEIEHLESKYDTDGWYRPVWEPTTPEEQAETQDLYDLLKRVILT